MVAEGEGKGKDASRISPLGNHSASLRGELLAGDQAWGRKAGDRGWGDLLSSAGKRKEAERFLKGHCVSCLLVPKKPLQDLVV